MRFTAFIVWGFDIYCHLVKGYRLLFAREMDSWFFEIIVLVHMGILDIYYSAGSWIFFWWTFWWLIVGCDNVIGFFNFLFLRFRIRAFAIAVKFHLWMVIVLEVVPEGRVSWLISWGYRQLSRAHRDACYQIFIFWVWFQTLYGSTLNGISLVVSNMLYGIIFLQSYNLDYSGNGVPSVK